MKTKALVLGAIAAVAGAAAGYLAGSAATSSRALFLLPSTGDKEGVVVRVARSDQAAVWKIHTPRYDDVHGYRFALKTTGDMGDVVGRSDLPAVRRHIDLPSGYRGWIAASVDIEYAEPTGPDDAETPLAKSRIRFILSHSDKDSDVLTSNKRITLPGMYPYLSGATFPAQADDGEPVSTFENGTSVVLCQMTDVTHSKMVSIELEYYEVETRTFRYGRPVRGSGRTGAGPASDGPAPPPGDRNGN